MEKTIVFGALTLSTARLQIPLHLVKCSWLVDHSPVECPVPMSIGQHKLDWVGYKNILILRRYEARRVLR